MKLAINMIVFNGETLIGAALRSVLPFVDEALVMDTGSNDQTMAILHGLQKEFPQLQVFQEDVQHLGPVWTGSRKDVELTRLLNVLRQRTKSEWIMRIDDDEIYPEDLMNEINDLQPTEDYYALFWYHVPKSNPCKMWNPYFFRHLMVLRIFRNIPEISWGGSYGQETIMVGKMRIPTRKCKSLKHHFLHLGEFRNRYDREKDIHGYLKQYQQAKDRFKCDVLKDLPQQYAKYIPQ